MIRTALPLMAAALLAACAPQPSDVVGDPVLSKTGAGAGAGAAVSGPVSSGGGSPLLQAMRQDPDGTDIATVFKMFCLERFPARPLMSGEMPPGTSSAAMTPQQVRQFLHDDPGVGWWYQTPFGTYAVTVEAPPYFACAVRRNYPSVPGYEAVYQENLRRWVEAEGRGPLRGEVGMAPANSRNTLAWARPVPGPRPEVLMRLETQMSARQVEVRLVRQIPNTPVRATQPF